MLSKAYRWTHVDTGSYLHFNYRCVAYAQPRADGKWHHVLRWQGREFHGVAGSSAQAVRWIESWIGARPGELPAFPVRRSRR
jgi:hypothetical protein